MMHSLGCDAGGAVTADPQGASPGRPGAARATANEAQRIASDPGVSAFVAASAGSGKTKLLTDRLLRLMLGGADPARIQCLTFTKAAAAEMAVRLQTTLGTWVTLPDAHLDAELAKLGIAPTGAIRDQSRQLFARVLDLPGGMRIGTIHAFCQSLLRRFPLEARLSPHFRLVDEADAALSLREAREDMLGAAHGIERRADLATLAGLATEQQFGRLVATLRADPERLQRAADLGGAGLRQALGRVLDTPPDEATLLAGAVLWPEEEALRQACRMLADHGSAKIAEKAVRLLEWLSLPAGARAEHWPQWCEEFFRNQGEPRGPGALVNSAMAKNRPEVVAALLAEQARIASIEDSRRAIRSAAVSAALASLAAPVARGYEERKQRAALLDYDDLVARSSRLLVDPGAAWVLYKLDGGLDHLLLDEVQDTAPAQWQIAGALTEEFFAGQGAREAQRTVFAVGDRKQSIYSFQGADPDQFDHWRALFRRRVIAAGAQWLDVPLNVSFRSGLPVLGLVDAVFANPLAAAGVVEPGESFVHLSDRAGQAGCVELWPLAPATDPEPPEPWQVPAENLPARGAPQRLAEALAGWIAAQTDGSVMLPSRGRALRAGDVLVLVRRRNAFVRALVRALKARGVPVAGLDRLVLTDQPAVADLLALADTLLLPTDALSLACVLTSPLGGLDQESLLALAAPRDGSLWDVLRTRAPERAEWTAAWTMLSTLLGRVDYAPPHALLAEALGPLGGRARLLARLGPEAAEPIDELLNAALAYAQAHPPSLQGFVQWLRQSGAEVKREAEGAGGQVRVMTVHGAKGLQAPLVILPDTTSLPPDDGPVAWAADPASNSGLEVPVWVPRKEFRCAAGDALRQVTAQRRAKEHNRLLYVALTRAEDRLLVCGWQTRRDPPAECWYNLVHAGFLAVGAAAAPFDAVPEPWPGERLAHEAAQSAPPDRADRSDAVRHEVVLPAWAGAAPLWAARPPPAEPAMPTPLAPSRPQDAALGSVPQAASPLALRDAGGARFRRGQLVHALLQHLPALPAAERATAAHRFLARPGHGLAPGEVRQVVAEVMAVLGHPALAPLFGPQGRAEVALTGVVEGRVVGGLVDRLAVLADRVLIADYKTNRTPPASLAAVPILYVRQMASYRAVLQAIHPDRPVACALVWTTGAQVMPLPPDLLDRHAPGADQSA
jgi:ATP-dependent helicase/nuclease subunit A